MNKPRDPRELAIDLLPRSICIVQVGAVLADDYGIFSWGWNSVGRGLGEHAEAAAFRRSSRKRLAGSTLYVASQRKDRSIVSKPCSDCQNLIEKFGVSKVWWRDNTGLWRLERL